MIDCMAAGPVTVFTCLEKSMPFVRMCAVVVGDQRILFPRFLLISSDGNTGAGLH